MPKKLAEKIIADTKAFRETATGLKNLIAASKNVKVGTEKHKGFSVGKPTLYVDGINTNDCLYFKEVGNTKTK